MSILPRTEILACAGLFVLSALTLSACSSVQVGSAPGLQPGDRVALLPIANYTETPQAGQRAQSIAQSILQQKGVHDLPHYVPQDDVDPLFGDSSARSQALALDWARDQQARYALTGSVQEWRYKVGVDGEPAVGLSFNLIDLGSGATVWSATGSRSGWSRSSLSGVAQSLINEMLSPLAVR